jgi:endonuclease YncB( thermonuclease family)
MYTIRILLLLTGISVAHADTLTGRVVGISDGDTITVLVARDPVKVRLANIDAPESGQPWGSRSKQSLSELCAGAQARLETQGKDRYGRTIATVFCNGTNANREQVRQGMAWIFDRYARWDSPLYAMQREAKLAERGLWSDPQPMPPWEWRRREWAGKEVVQPAATSGAAPSQVTPRKWLCDRKEAGQDRVELDCGWR